MKNINRHDFHMVLQSELKNKIKDLSFNIHKSLSDTVVYIIEKTLCFYKNIYYHLDESDKFCTYKKINWDEDIHVYFNIITYRQIKHLADTYFAFSMAIVIRWLITYYFENIYNSKDKKENKELIEKAMASVEESEKNIKSWMKKIKSIQLSDNLYKHLIFNEKFTVIGFDFRSS